VSFLSERDEDEFRGFASGSVGPLGRLAYLLCGDWYLAQDLVQTCLIRMYRSWPKIIDRDSVDGYARTVLLRCWLNEQRKPWRRSESRDGMVPEKPDTSRDPALLAELAQLRNDLRRALAKVPPRQRATVVLRYWSALSVTETAATLRCSEGTVKSQTARGLATLRKVLGEQSVGENPKHEVSF
jgi:RNA polymerase sigma-70 factor (sigma-E family)